jgi:hypothetical protein
MVWRWPAETSTYLAHLSKYVWLSAAAVTDEACQASYSQRSTALEHSSQLQHHRDFSECSGTYVTTFPLHGVIY